MLRPFHVFCVALSLLLLGLPARAEDMPAGATTETASASPAAPSPKEKAEQARTLFKEGRKLMSEGKLEEACQKLEESLALDDGMGTRFNLAACYEKQGRTASAHKAYLQVAEQAKASGQAEREKVARERVVALGLKLSTLELLVQEPVDGLELSSNGKPVDKASWSTAVPVDPGPFTLEARAPGRKPWSQTTTVPPANAVVVIVIPELALLAPEPAPVPPAAPPPEAKPVEEAAEEAAPEEQAPVEDEVTKGRAGMRTASLIVGGAAIGALVAGTTFALQYQTSNKDARAVCRKSVDCTPQELALHESLVEDSKNSATLAYVGFGIGAVGLIGATLLYVGSAPERTKGSEQQSSARLRPSAGFGPDGSWAASLGGSF